MFRQKTRIATWLILAAGLTVMVALACTREVEVVVEKIVEVEVTPIAPVTDTPTETYAQPETASSLEYMRASEPNPKYGGILRNSFAVAELKHYDIHQGIGACTCFLGHSYEMLVALNQPKGNRGLVGQLAESWDISNGGKTYTFKLRKGVKFHDGTPFSSADVVATFNRIIFPPEGITSTNQQSLSFVKSVKAIDDNTVEFQLSGPRAYFLQLLSNATLVVYSKKTLEENNNDLKQVKVAPGTGPFKFVEYRQTEHTLFERNEDYWFPELPYLDGIKQISSPTAADRGLFIITGLSDMTWGTTPVVARQAAKEPDKFGTALAVTTGSWPLAINFSRKPFDDPRVRRAMHLATNKHTVWGVINPVFGTVLSGWHTAGSAYAPSLDELERIPGFRKNNSEDIAEAKRLMADAGYADGIKDVNFLVPSVPMFAEAIGPAIQEQLKTNLGIETSFTLFTRGESRQEALKGNFDLYIYSGVAPLHDPVLQWGLYFKTGGPLNLGGYSNPELDAILEKMEAALPDTATRARLVYDAEQILGRDVPGVQFGTTAHAPVWRLYVKGMAMEDRKFSEWDRIYTAWLDN